MVFVAHPMSGEIVENTRKVTDICRKIHTTRTHPVFPSFTTRRYLTQTAKDRKIAKAHILQYLRRGFIDELWLFGDHISAGMWREIRTARKFGIPVVAKTGGTKKELRAAA